MYISTYFFISLCLVSCCTPNKYVGYIFMSESGFSMGYVVNMCRLVIRWNPVCMGVRVFVLYLSFRIMKKDRSSFQ